MRDIYVDRFMKFAVHQGVVRIDFARIETYDEEKEEFILAPSTSVALPVDAFMHFSDQVAGLRAEILQRAESANKDET